MCLDGSSVKLEEVEEIPKETEGIVDIELIQIQEFNHWKLLILM